MDKEQLHIDPNKIHLNFVENVLIEMDEIDLDQETHLRVESQVAHLSGYNLENKEFFLGLHVVCNIEGQENTFAYHFRYNFHYVVENLDEMYTLNENEAPVFSKLFVATLAGISYSTLRGIILEKTSVKGGMSILLPVINPSIILESWITQG